MSFYRHFAKCVKKKSEIEKPTSDYAIGLSYSLLSCSPALLNSASLNDTNLTKSNSTV